MILSNNKLITKNGKCFKQGVYFDYGFDAETYGCIIQPDGKMIIIGAFYYCNGIAMQGIIRLMPDGSIDETFNNGQIGVDNYAYCMALQPDGKIILGGSFQNYNGIPCGNVIRLMPNGNLDPTFTVYSGVFTTACIVVRPNGKIIVAGDMSSPELYQLNLDGSLDINFNIGGSGFDNYISCMVLLPDGRLVIGGLFSSYNGINSNCIIILNTNGTIDASFNIGSGFDDQVWSIAVQDDGKIIVTGDMGNYQGNPCNNILRLNTDASLDTTFNAEFNASPYIATIQYDGKIVVGGSFTTINGLPCGHITRLNSDGTIDPKFNTLTGFDGQVLDIKIQSYNGKYIVVGYFQYFNGSLVNHIARLNLDGTLDK